MKRCALLLLATVTQVFLLSPLLPGEGEGEVIKHSATARGEAAHSFSLSPQISRGEGRGEGFRSFDTVRANSCPSDLRLFDRRGEVLHEVRVDPTRRRLRWVPLDAISPALPRAILASEDHRFFAHHGVDWRAVAGALWQRLRGGPPRGASTITMQLAALLDPALRHRGSPRSWTEKREQVRAAWEIERQWTKAQILEAYLNLVTFRGEVQGVAAAAEVLFRKAPHGLTRAEAAVLAALVRAPNAEPAALTRRAAALLDAPDELLAAAVARAVGAPAGGGPRVALAPHAARRLLRAVDAGACADAPSTLDATLQRVAAESLRRHLLAIRDRSVNDGAVLVANNATGEVLAYVAASGDLSPARHVDGIQARRQAGSTLKPFLYALALDRRLLTPASLLEDTPLEIAAGPGLFRPHNYDDRFRGLVSVRTALAGSLNVPAVRALGLVGAGALATQLHALGFDGVVADGDFYGPSLALGTADVTLWELVAAYRALAAGGVWNPLRWASEAAPPPGPRVTSEAAAFIVADILADREGRSVTFGLESPLATPFWSAVKTGTSQDMRDNWCIGFTRRYTVGVWVGNFSGQAMHDVSGVTGAAPVWQEVMTWLHRDLPSEPPQPPPGVRAALTSFPGDAEPRRREWFLAGTEPAAAPPALAHHERILAPADGTIIALDPDIPSDRQRIAFTAASAGAPLRWTLDGIDLGNATITLLWPPAPGHHTLALVDAEARPVALARFEVRGARD